MLVFGLVRRILVKQTGKLAAVSAVALALAMAACNHVQDGSDVRVTNGLNIGEGTYPAVVQILMGGGACTGTFVSDTTMITASHCVLEGGQIIGVTVESTGARSSKVLIHPNATGQVGGTDLAVAIFPSGTSQAFMPIAKRRPAEGDEITIVGYGKSDHTNNATGGRKRLGKNRLLDASGNELVFSGEIRNVGQTGNGINSASSNGDSGGPMFIKDELVGVTSGGYDDGQQKHSFYVNLISDSNMAFLKSTLARGAKIPSLQDDPLLAANRDLYVAIGSPAADATDTFSLFAGVGDGVTAVVFCRANKISLCPEGAKGYTRAVKDREFAGRLLFKGETVTAIKDGEILSFVALDAQGRIVSAKAVKFQAAAE
jgi:hypothetical protein